MQFCSNTARTTDRQVPRQHGLVSVKDVPFVSVVTVWPFEFVAFGVDNGASVGKKFAGRVLLQTQILRQQLISSSGLYTLANPVPNNTASSQ